MTPPNDKTVIAQLPPAPEEPPASSEPRAGTGANAVTETSSADDERTVVIPASQPTAEVGHVDGADNVVDVAHAADAATTGTGSNVAAATSTATAPAVATAIASAPHALPVGMRLAEFEIVRLIGEGGFGIVYLADDTQLGRRVALKEYIPSTLASRAANAQVTVKSERHAETFRAGLKSFINEARLLAQFDHQSLVKVYRFWEANGTAYMVMPYYEGETLKDALKQRGTPPDEEWLRALLAPLAEALAVLHGAQCYHRDIAPDNIMLLKGSGRPLLLDFGAARRVIGDMTQALTVILKPGYAPVEQYAEVPSMKQGPWTDLYALAAVVYFAILGKTPPAAVGRLLNDTYEPLAVAAAGRYSDGFLRAIDHALSVQPNDRPQHVFAMAAELGLAIGETAGKGGTGIAGAASGDFSASHAGEAGGSGSASTSRHDDVTRIVPLDTAPRPAASAASSGAGGQTGARAAGGTIAASPAGNAASSSASADKRRSKLAAIAVGAAIVVGVGGWLTMRLTSSPPNRTTVVQPLAAGHALPTDATTPTSPGQPSTSTAAAPAAPPAGTASTQPSTAPSATTPPLASTQAPTDTPLPPYTPGGEFDRIVSLADPSFRVTTTLRSTVARINRDRLQFRLASDRAGYAYVFMVDPDGQYLMLFPNALDTNNAIAAGRTLSLPRGSWPMLAGAPAGPNRFLAIVSPVQRDFSGGGLQRGSVFASFPPDARNAAAARRTARYSPFAGEPQCRSGTASCADTFGATAFTIDVVN